MNDLFELFLMPCVMINKNFSSNSIFFVKINPSPLSHSSVTGLLANKTALPFTFQIVLSVGSFIFSPGLGAQPVSI